MILFLSFLFSHCVLKPVSVLRLESLSNTCVIPVPALLFGAKGLGGCLEEAGCAKG